MGIIGKTQGVSMASSPEPKAKKNQPHSDLVSLLSVWVSIVLGAAGWMVDLVLFDCGVVACFVVASTGSATGATGDGVWVLIEDVFAPVDGCGVCGG